MLLKEKEKKPKKILVILSLKKSKPGYPLLLHDEPIYLDNKLIGRTTSANYSFNYKKNIVFGYINSKANLDKGIIEIEVEKTRYVAITEHKPLHDSNNKLIKI